MYISGASAREAEKIWLQRQRTTDRANAVRTDSGGGGGESRGKENW